MNKMKNKIIVTIFFHRRTKGNQYTEAMKQFDKYM